MKARSTLARPDMQARYSVVVQALAGGGRPACWSSVYMLALTLKICVLGPEVSNTCIPNRNPIPLMALLVDSWTHGLMGHVEVSNTCIPNRNPIPNSIHNPNPCPNPVSPLYAASCIHRGDVLQVYRQPVQLHDRCLIASGMAPCSLCNSDRYGSMLVV